ncbi:MAG: efflux RND transporter permease subunit [Armatimonadetes bacterium]|nr:efflux RND transporter permease subunit [Armatimonadota bacterium]
MSPTKLAFAYRPVTVLLALLVLALGLTGLFTMSRREDPDLKGRFAQVVALYPGASASQVELQVTEKLERTLREIDDVGNVTSTSRPGVAVIQVEAADRMTDTLDKLMDQLRKRSADLKPQLPAGVVSVAVNDRFADTSALIFAVTQPGASSCQLEVLAKQLRDQLKPLPEVGETQLLGAEQEVITVALSSQRLAARGGAVTTDSIAAAISRKNVLPDVGGSATAGDTRLTLTPTGNLAELAELENLVVGASETGAPVYLRDVATVTRGFADPPSSLFRVSGAPSVGVSITMRKGGNISELGKKAQEVVRKLALPAGAKITTVNNLPKSVERRVDGFFHELLLAVGIIFLVMLAFMGWRSALLVGVMLPLSMLATFAAMWLTGREVQQMSIAALIIALALVVDNSIVVLDNIEEKLSSGLAREQAAILGADELRGPFLTANLVAISSFLPLAFLPGGVGDFVRDLGLVTALSLVVSVLLNLTVLPLLCFRFLRAGHDEKKTAIQRGLDRGVDALREGKASLAQSAFRRPGVVVGIAALALFGAVSLIPRLGFAFFPPAERDQFVVDIWLPEGRDIRATERAVKKVEALLAEQKGIVSFVSYIGQGGPRFYYNISPETPTANYAQLIVNTETLEQTGPLVATVQSAARVAVPEARVTAKKLEQGPPVGAPVAVRVTGSSVESLRRAATELEARLNGIAGTHSVHNSYGELPLQLKVNVDEDRAAALGLSSAVVAQTARLAYTGQVVSLLREGDKEIPIELRGELQERVSPESLRDLYLPGGVQLQQVATLALTPGEGRIVRRNGQQTLTVSAYLDGSRLASAIVDDLKVSLVKQPLTETVALGYGGEQEEANKSFVNMIVVFAVAFVFNLVVLMVQFNSVPIVTAILASVPLGVIGAVPGLFLAHQNFGFMAFLGIAALGGIVTNHTIFVFHYAQEEQRHQQISMADALVDASRRRLRPILLTVLLSVGALLPQAYSGSKLWPPLDWAIIAGLLVSTFLTMIVIPSVYALLARGEARRIAAPSAVMLLLLTTLPAQAQTQLLTVDQAVAQALSRSRSIQLAEASLHRATGKTTEARAALRPTAGVSANLVRLNRGQRFAAGPATIQGAYLEQAQYAASATLPLDIVGLLSTAKSAAQLDELIAQLGVEKARQEVSLDVRLACYELTRGQALLQVAKAAQETAQQRLKDAEASQRAGIAPRLDVLRAQTGLAEAQQRLLQAENGVALARAALATKLVLPLETALSLAELALPNKTDANEADEVVLRNQALAQRPELLQARAGIRASELGVKLAQRSLLPSMGISLGGQYNPNAGALSVRDIAQVAVGITVPLSDGGMARARRQQAEAEKESAQAALSQAEEAVALEVRQAVLNTRDAEARLAVALQVEATAQEAARLSRVKYNAGVSEGTVSPLLDLADAQAALTQAQSNVINARCELLSARARRDRARGAR